MSPDALGWDACAQAWSDSSARFERAIQKVTLKLLERLELFSGETVAEVACGPGGMIPLLADAVAPGGHVIAGDISAQMVEHARDRVAEAGVPGVELGVLDLDWLDLPSASVGALVGRFAYMFASDPAAALGDARRVLRPGGRFATAVWDSPERNPYGSIPLECLVEVGLGDPPVAGAPGMFRLAEEGAIERLLLDAGFLEVEVESVPVNFTFRSFDDYLGWTLGLSQRVSTALAEGVEGTVEEFSSELTRRVAPFTSEAGAIDLPGVVLVASGRA